MYNLLILNKTVKSAGIYNKRCFWQWLNYVFNNVDEERRKLLGPDRTCAEWLLRNGAAVKWTSNSDYLSDYNNLPPEDVKLYIKEVDASNSSISHYGFPHFRGCKHITKIVFHKCDYLENEAIPLLKPLDGSLKYLKISNCGNITEVGVNALASLKNLTYLEIVNLPYLKDRKGVFQNLRSYLPECTISVN